MTLQNAGQLRKAIATQLLPVYHNAEADQVAALLIEHLFGHKPIEQLLAPQIEMTYAIDGKIKQMIQRLLQEEPWQYVLGYTHFYGRVFQTDSRALIPRPETEELVALALEQQYDPDYTLLDIGTGTGCIAITLALETGCKTYALDLSAEAIALAQDNAQSLGASVEFIQADILSSALELPKLDLIISNPPYVPESDRASINPRVKDFEPDSALFVPDSNLLLFYRRITALAPEYLKPGGQLYLEIYHTQSQEVLELLQAPRWSQAITKKDLQGKDRLVSATFQG